MHMHEVILENMLISSSSISSWRTWVVILAGVWPLRHLSLARAGSSQNLLTLADLIGKGCSQLLADVLSFGILVVVCHELI